MNPDEAELFIVPYDFILNEFYIQTTIGGNKKEEKTEYKCTRRGKRKGCPGSSAELKSFLESSKYFQRNNGLDHILIYS